MQEEQQLAEKDAALAAKDTELAEALAREQALQRQLAEAAAAARAREAALVKERDEKQRELDKLKNACKAFMSMVGGPPPA